MKTLLATIYTEFETSVVDDSGMEQVDAVLAGPVGGSLTLKFRRAESASLIKRV